MKNIIGLIDINGNLVVKYTQDVWGYQKSIADTSPVNIGSKNPFRYKGYYYYVETGLAMVGQRYYSPELCRFIQPADVSTLNPHSINGLNIG